LRSALPRDGNGAPIPDPRWGFPLLGDVIGELLIPAGSLAGGIPTPSGEAGARTFPIYPSPFPIGVPEIQCNAFYSPTQPMCNTFYSLVRPMRRRPNNSHRIYKYQLTLTFRHPFPILTPAAATHSASNQTRTPAGRRKPMRRSRRLDDDADVDSMLTDKTRIHLR
jgi:hypothetical protein